MSLQSWAWLALVAYTLHVLEEHAFDWRNWARSVIGLPVEWSDFYVTNAAVVVLGFAQAEMVALFPLAALSFAGLMLVNATFFHVMPMIRTRGRFSPGAFTAVVLFYPVGLAVFFAASREGHLSGMNLMGAFVIAALLMAFPVVMLKAKGLPYFRQAP